MGDDASKAPSRGAWERASFFASIVVPTVVIAAHAESIADASHDLGMARVAGFAWTGAWRALDAILGALVLWLPLGTRALRASLASAACAGIAGGVLHVLARRVLGAREEAPRVSPAVAAIASMTATLGVAWQLEGASPGGSVVGALLAVAPLLLLASRERMYNTHIGSLALLLGLALSYEPLVGAAAVVSSGTYVGLTAGRRGFVALLPARGQRRRALPALLAFVAFAVPPAFAWIRGHADPRMVLPRAAFSAPLGEGGASGHVNPLDLVRAELGWVLAALAVAGVVLAFLAPRARPLAAGLAAIAGVGFAGIVFGAPAGPARWAGSTLAALGATTAFAAVGMQSAVLAVARARIPFAQASAAMIVLLEIALPAQIADEAWTRAAERARSGSTWDEAAWSTVPEGSIVLLRDTRALERIAATRASGAMRPDVAIVPLESLGGPMASVEVAREPKLHALVRDMALEGAPEELSLSSLAAARPLMMTFDPRWEKALARHLVPAGLFARFETEPRGASDRRRALELARPPLDLLERASTAPADIDTCAAAASLLRVRAIAWAAANDRELVARELDELRPFAPDDRVASELARRVVTSKGGIDMRDLLP